MTLTLETIISESHTKSGNNTWKTWDDIDSSDHYLRDTQRVGTTPGKHGMTLTLETIISESHTKSGNNTWRTWDDVDSRDHYLRVTHKEWEQHLENMG